MSEDIIKLAREALEDEKRGTPGPEKRIAAVAAENAALADAARLRGLLAECLTPLRGYEMEADFEESQSTASLIARIDAALSGGGKEAK